MSWRATAWAYDLELPGLTKMVLLTLAEHHNAETGQCNPKVKRIAYKAGMSERSAERHLAELVKLGLIQIKHNYREDGSKRNSDYILLAPPGVTVTPGGATVADQEPVIESVGTVSGSKFFEKNSSPETVPATPKKKSSKDAISPIKTIVNRAFLDLLVEEYPALINGASVSDHIEKALGWKSYEKTNDKQKYLRQWLNRQVKWEKDNAAGIRDGSVAKTPGGENGSEAGRARAKRMEDFQRQADAVYAERTRQKSDAGNAGQAGVSEPHL